MTASPPPCQPYHSLANVREERLASVKEEVEGGEEVGLVDVEERWSAQFVEGTFPPENWKSWRTKRKQVSSSLCAPHTSGP